MTPERAKELLPVIQAFVEGKTIESRPSGTDREWETCKYPTWYDLRDYRIKPEPKYGWIILGIGYSTWVENGGKIYQDEETAIECAGLLSIETKVRKIRLDDDNDLGH